MALVDQFVSDHGCPCAVGDSTCVGSSARRRSAAPSRATLPAWRIRAGWPGARYLGYLGSPTVSIYGPDQSTRLSHIGREWNHGGGRVDRVLLPTLYRHGLQARKSLARLPKTGVSSIQHGCRD